MGDVWLMHCDGIVIKEDRTIGHSLELLLCWKIVLSLEDCC